MFTHFKRSPIKVVLFELPIATDDGEYTAHYSATGLAELDSPNDDGLIAPCKGRAVSSQKIPPQVLKWHRTTTDALRKILAGRAPKEFPPFDWTGKTEFQKSVWQAMLKIPLGKTKSYGEVAKAVGRWKAVRAVGGACGANPFPVLVPCHRVLAAGKKIGGFGGGLDRKRNLLAREGVILQ
jgi:O-6-methylguanine DNA methyltransferase